MEIATIVILAIICIALIIWLSVTIIASLTIIRKLKAKINLQREVNTFQHNHNYDLKKVIADQKAEIDSYKFVCKASEDIIEVLENEIEENENTIKQLIPQPDEI